MIVVCEMHACLLRGSGGIPPHISPDQNLGPYINKPSPPTLRPQTGTFGVLTMFFLRSCQVQTLSAFCSLQKSQHVDHHSLEMGGGGGGGGKTNT